MTQDSASQPSPEYTPDQLRRMASVYEMMAQLLPTEGRDYGVKFIFPETDDHRSVSVSFETYTRIGKLWCDYCTEAMKGGQR